MGPSAVNTESQTVHANAYHNLLMVNEKLEEVRKNIFCASELWRLTPGYSNTQEYPEHWTDPEDQLDWDDPGADAWFLEARNKGLFDSRTALKEELGRLGSSKKDLENVQTKLRGLINDVSRPKLRSWHILELPEEILCKVFESLDHKWLGFPSLSHIVSQDIRNCRLVCQRFCRTSSRFFLHSVSVDLRLSSVSRYEEISRHPTISKGIRVIRVVLHYYDPILSNSFMDFIEYHAAELDQQIEFMEALKSWEHSGLSGETGRDVVGRLKAILASWKRLVSQPQPDSSREEDEMHLELLTTAHQRYQKLYLDQEDLRQSGKFPHIIANGLLNMPRARTLLIVDRHTRTNRRPSLFEYDDIKLPVYEAILQPINYYTAYKYGFSPKLCDVISELPAAFPQVEIDLSYVEAPSNLLARSELQLSSALQQLKSFSFQCRIWMNEDLGEDALGSVLAPWLNTPSLEELTIDMASDEESDDRAMPYVGRLVTSGKQQKLSSVFLRDVTFQSCELQHLTRRLQEPCCSINLERTRLLDGTWAEALDSLRKTSIRSVRLSDPLGAECEDMPSGELSNIFGRSETFAWSKAEQYIRGVIRHNPLRDEIA